MDSSSVTLNYGEKGLSQIFPEPPHLVPVLHFHPTLYLKIFLFLLVSYLWKVLSSLGVPRSQFFPLWVHTHTHAHVHIRHTHTISPSGLSRNARSELPGEVLVGLSVTLTVAWTSECSPRSWLLVGSDPRWSPRPRPGLPVTAKSGQSQMI